MADLICREDFRLIRACDGPACTLLFLDRTKSHARRWCSMAVCGNRAKAAAHRARTSRRRVQHGRLRQPREGGRAPRADLAAAGVTRPVIAAQQAGFARAL
jgi:hypothetical protein